MAAIALGVLAAIILAVGFGKEPFWRSAFQRGLFVGASAVGATWMGWEVLRRLGEGAESKRKGAEGEESTAAALKPLRRRGWHILHDIEFPGEFNIDHVAIGHSGVLAVETKWTGTPWKVRYSRHGRPALSGPFGDPLRNSKRGVHRLRELLAMSGLTDVPIEAVLVIWGPGAPVIDNGWVTIESVYVLDGYQARKWRHALQERPDRLDDGLLVNVTKAIQRHQESTVIRD